MRWTTKEDVKLKDLYIKNSFNIEKIAKIMNRSVPSLSLRLTVLKVKRRNPHLCQCPSEITSALARIHAHVCGDGCLYQTKEKDIYGPWAQYRKKPIRTRYVVSYCNNNQKLLKEFKRDIKEVFRIRGNKIYDNEIKVRSKKVWSLLKEMGAGGSYEWSIPEEILKGSEMIRKNWIRAFFDDEAFFEEDMKKELLRIRLKCVNKKGLVQLQEMLSKFIPCHLLPKKGFYANHSVCLNINKKDALDFLAKIGSVKYNKKPV
ncbi:MAG: hypothetical protein PHW31_01490 [Candidatus Pacebacteria bacterium]|nr:hypothetical protein [Candidatus Paceibacterota bacterium]